MVPIPVFGKQLSEEPSVLADVGIPAISVTKPPAPQPLNLPSVNDVVPIASPPDSNRPSVDLDLEAGRGLRRPVNDNVITSRPSVQKVTPPSAASSDNISPAEPSPTGEEDTDLLADAAPLEAAFSPSLSVKLERSAADDVAEPRTTLSLAQEDVLAESTIRLVGGGSSSGVDSIPLDDAEEAVISDISVVAESSESSSKKEQVRDKTKSSSLSSFKRLSAHLTSGKRKKDSVSSNSVKEAL